MPTSIVNATNSGDPKITTQANPASSVGVAWRITCWLGTAVLVFAAIVATPRPSEASSSGACTTTNGVTVVVDYGTLGGGTSVRCAPGGQGSGISALRNAGFSVTDLSGNLSLGFFVCRINGQPGSGQENCAVTPPRGSSWVYWHASRGGSWQFSNSGAANRTPPAGSVEGWRFGGGGQVKPSVAPPARIVEPTRPANKPRPTTKPTRPSSGNTSNSGSSTTNSKDSTSSKSPSSSSSHLGADKDKSKPATSSESASKDSVVTAQDGDPGQDGSVTEASAADGSGSSSGSSSLMWILLGGFGLACVASVAWWRRPRGVEN